MLNLFSKEKALYLIDNPTKIGFSWWFFFAGIVAGFWMFRRYGSDYYVVMIFNKYLFLIASGFFLIMRKMIEKAVKLGKLSRSSEVLYLVPLGGYVATFFATMWVTHLIFQF